MPKKIANKDLPPATDVPGGDALVKRVERSRARLAKVGEAADKKDAKLRTARKKLKRAQRKLRKARIHTSTHAKKAAAGGAA